MTKFYSKINNYRILLTPNIPGNPYMQIPPTYGKSVKFNQGAAEVTDPEIIELLRSNAKFGKEYFEVEADPLAGKRVSSEPVHDIMEIDGGRPGKSVSSAPSVSPKKIEELVMAMAKQLIEAGGYVKAEEPKDVPVQQPVQQHVDDEPMDTALSDSVEAVQEDEPRDVVVPPPITAVTEKDEDDGINPLAGTMPEGEDVVPEDEQDSGPAKAKFTAKKAKK